MYSIKVEEILGYMAKRGFTRKRFAERLGVAENTLRSYLLNPENIPYEIIAKMIYILEIPIDEAREIFLANNLHETQVNQEG